MDLCIKDTLLECVFPAKNFFGDARNWLINENNFPSRFWGMKALSYLPPEDFRQLFPVNR